LMLPTISGWLQFLPASVVLRRLLLIACALALVAIGYFGLVWTLRDWIFVTLLKKNILRRDELVLLWFAVGLLMLLRDQLIFLLLARERFHSLTTLTAASALVSLTVSVLSMRLIGVTGALLGVLAGEAVNVSCLLTLSTLEARRRPIVAA
jgi:O-antigen/teichoic acid export membrane protein